MAKYRTHILGTKMSASKREQIHYGPRLKISPNTYIAFNNIIVADLQLCSTFNAMIDVHQGYKAFLISSTPGHWINGRGQWIRTFLIGVVTSRLLDIHNDVVVAPIFGMEKILPSSVVYTTGIRILCPATLF